MKRERGGGGIKRNGERERDRETETENQSYSRKTPKINPGI